VFFLSVLQDCRQVEFLGCYQMFVVFLDPCLRKFILVM
jgi:hypothetical protein